MQVKTTVTVFKTTKFDELNDESFDVESLSCNFLVNQRLGSKLFTLRNRQSFCCFHGTN